MSVTVIDPISEGYVPNGATTSFPFDFKIASADEISVYQVVNGVPVLVSPSAYTVTIAADGEGGTVTFVAAPLTGSGTIYLVSDPLFTQRMTLSAEGPFTPAVLNPAFDRAAIRDIYLKGLLDRAIIAPIGEAPATLPPAAARAGLSLGFGPTGDPVAVNPGGADSALRTDLVASTGWGLVGIVKSFAGAVVRKLSDLFAKKLTPADFGAKGDGVTDDYAAFVLFAAALSNSSGIRASLEGKTYSIGQHATAANGVLPIAIQNATGLILDGGGATISFQGNFDRNVSTTTSIGLQFVSCAKSKFFNFTVDGNVDQMTNSSSSVESFNSYNINILGCVDCEFENIETHHAATDGIAINGTQVGPTWVGSKRITLTSVNSYNNARCNFSVFTAEFINWKNCRNTFAGVTGGAYPAHAPHCGLDIEPDFGTFNGADINCNNIHFEDCYWANNTGGDIISVLTTTISGNLTFTRCTVNVATTTTVSPINIGVPGLVKFEDCQLNLGGQRIELDGASGLAIHVFENCDISGTCLNFELIHSLFTSKFTSFNRCRFTCTATQPKTTTGGGVTPFLITNPNLVFDGDCQLFIPTAWFRDEGGGACAMFNATFRHADNMKFTTDHAVAGQYFYGIFNSSILRACRFTGGIVGTADTIRPALGSAFDTHFTYSLGDGFEGHSGGIDALADANATLGLWSKKTQRVDVALTAARTVTLPAPGNTGRRFRIVRTANATGAFNLNINTSAAALVKTLATAGNWAEVEDDGTEYRLIGSGPL